MDKKMDDIISKEYGSTPRNVQLNLTVEEVVYDIIEDIISNVFENDKKLPISNSTQALRQKHGFNIPELDQNSCDDDEVRFDQV